MNKTQLMINLVIFSLGSAPVARADDYTKEQLCRRLSSPPAANIALLSGVGIGVGIYELVKAVPELKEELEARRNGLDKVKNASSNTDMAIAYYEREAAITKRIMGRRDIPKTPMKPVVRTGAKYESEVKYAKQFFDLEDKEMGPSSLNNLLRKYQAKNDVKAVAAIQELIKVRVNMLSQNKDMAVALMRQKTTPQLAKEGATFADGLANQSEVLNKLVGNLVRKREEDALLRRWKNPAGNAIEFQPKISAETKDLASLYKTSIETNASVKKRIAAYADLKKSLVADYQKSDIFEPIDASLSKEELARTLKVRDGILNDIVGNSIKNGSTTLGKQQNIAELMKPMGVNKDLQSLEHVKTQKYLQDVDKVSKTNGEPRDFGGLNETSEGSLVAKKGAVCKGGGLVALGIAGVVSSLSNYCDNQISKDFEMSLPKSNRDQFAKMKGDYHDCIDELTKDPTLFAATQTFFKTKDQEARTPAAEKKEK